MVNGALNNITASRDFRFEQCDALVQLIHRKGIEVLARELGGGVVLSAGKIVRVHSGKVGLGCGRVKRVVAAILRNCGLDVMGCDPDSGAVLGGYA